MGKQEQDDFFTAEENVQRKKLEVEMEDTEELVKKREVCCHALELVYQGLCGKNSRRGACVCVSLLKQ